MRIITASKSPNYTDYMTFQYERQEFSVHYRVENDEYNGTWFQCQVTEIHPYDDAEYVWAKYDGYGVTFIQDGKKVKYYDMQEYYYDGDLTTGDEVYASFDEFMKDVLEFICMHLTVLNKSVKPRMVHW